MRIPLYRTASILLFLLFFALGNPPSVNASNYAVTPLVLDHDLEKRDIVTEMITVANNSDRIVRIYPTVNEIALDAGGSVAEFVEPSMSDRTTSITSWLSIARGRLELQPHEVKEIALTIKVNPDVVPGEYHAFVGFPEGSNRPDAEKKVYEGNVPGTVVRIGVDTEQNQFLRLERFAVERFVKDPAEGSIQYVLSNPGDDPVVPHGEIIFYDNHGTEVSALPVNPEGAAVEPNQEHAFTSTVSGDLKMGKYKAFLSVEYGEHQTASVHDTAFFYVLPLQYVIALFISVLVLAIGAALFVHRKFDMGSDDDDGADEVALFIRSGRSENKDHDIDLSKKNNTPL